MIIDNRPCRYCFDFESVHVEGKCVFGPTLFEPLNHVRLEKLFMRGRGVNVLVKKVRFVYRGIMAHTEVFRVEETVMYRDREDFNQTSLRDVKYSVSTLRAEFDV